MARELDSDRAFFVLGDVRDREAVRRVVDGAGYVIHAAALKHVVTGERQPWSVVHTNIIGTKNVADAAAEHGATMVLLSTDKAVQPVNLYGATKMAAERITLERGHRVVRYGNVFGSRGSVLHKFKEAAANRHTFSITDPRMTRFVITFDQAIQLVLQALTAPPRSVTVPTLPAIRIVDLAKAFDESADFEVIGIQDGEKLHEVLSDTQSSETAEKLTVEEIRGLIDACV
jgi:UDP-N-acetylglucosamine 4,6-dehydratase